MRQRKFASKAVGILVAGLLTLSAVPFSAQAAIDYSMDVNQYETDIIAARIKLTGYMDELRAQSKNETHTYLNWEGNERSLSNIHYITAGSPIEITKDPSYNGEVKCEIAEYKILPDGSAELWGVYRIGIDDVLREEDIKRAAEETASNSGSQTGGAVDAGHASSPMYHFVGQTYMGEGMMGSDAQITAIPTRIEFRDYGFTKEEDLGDPLECSYNFGKTDRLYRFTVQMYPTNGEGSSASYNFRVAGTPAAEAELTATPNRSTVLVNGQNMAFDAYTINQSNYFKLRDLAKILSGTGKQFEVSWDGSKNAINMISGQPYTVVGGELAAGDGANKAATLNASTIYLNGAPVALTAYTIGGNNYFKLRDIGATFDFGVDWDGVKNTIVIDTSKSYTPD